MRSEYIARRRKIEICPDRSNRVGWCFAIKKRRTNGERCAHSTLKIEDFGAYSKVPTTLHGAVGRLIPLPSDESELHKATPSPDAKPTTSHHRKPAVLARFVKRPRNIRLRPRQSKNRSIRRPRRHRIGLVECSVFGKTRARPKTHQNEAYHRERPPYTPRAN